MTSRLTPAALRAFTALRAVCITGINVLTSALLCITLTACATTATAPTQVKIPISVACTVATPEPPVWATAALPPDADLFAQVKALLAERLQRMAYETELRAALQACQS